MQKRRRERNNTVFQPHGLETHFGMVLMGSRVLISLRYIKQGSIREYEILSYKNRFPFRKIKRKGKEYKHMSCQNDDGYYS